MWNKRQVGMTLIELIIAMVIVGIGVAGLTAAFTRTARASADPVVYKQLVATAEGMMEEILLKPYAVNTASALTREEFNDVRDFDNYGRDASGKLIVGITDVNGVAIAGLEQYSVAVSVTPATLTASTSALRITVTVSRGEYTFVLTGWRTDYA